MALLPLFSPGITLGTGTGSFEKEGRGGRSLGSSPFEKPIVSLHLPYVIGAPPSREEFGILQQGEGAAFGEDFGGAAELHDVGGEGLALGGVEFADGVLESRDLS